VKINSQDNFKKMNTTEVKGNWNEQKGKLKRIRPTNPIFSNS
jgi:hypothetical protein